MIAGRRVNDLHTYVVDSGDDYAERRKLVIQESKYLGGDMEHTHLVKGLDYALLEKVRQTRFYSCISARS